jgi:hypothetical protein
MGDDRNRILDLLASGKITVEEATRLLDALDTGAGATGTGSDSGGAAGAAAAGAGAGAAGAKTGWPKFFASGDKSAGGAGAGGGAGGKGGSNGKHAFMYVKVLSEKGDNVNVKIPLGLLRAGLKLTSLIPKQASDEINKAMAAKGMSFNINDFKPEDIEELIEALSEMEVEVDSNNGDTVRVYVA